MRVDQYGRLALYFQTNSSVDRLEFTGPDGAAAERPVFVHQPTVFEYDDHGYEHLRPAGAAVLSARFTPRLPGIYRYKAYSGENVAEEGLFEAVHAGLHGYVQISSADSRYFAYSDGACYCPIGLNMVYPTMYKLPQGDEFALSGREATLGLSDYRRWLQELAEAGGNYARLWLSHAYFDVETGVAGEVNPLAFARLDAVIEAARALGIRLKLTLEHFRDFRSANMDIFLKKLVHPATGELPHDMDDWFTGAEWQRLWMAKIAAYMARYADDPVIMAWELWNEINACRVSRFEVVREWTRRTLPRIKAMSPANLVTNSLGSFDREEMAGFQQAFHMDEMDFQQVHRYVDQGAPWAICRNETYEAAADAVLRARRDDLPVILAETGAVNDHHTGPFRFYRSDRRGILFHDTTYPPFFAGSAGTGQIWHWDERYVDAKRLFRAYRPFAELLTGVAVDRENFQTADLSDDRVWLRLLVGKSCVLGYLRNRADNWQKTLRDRQEPGAIPGQLAFPLEAFGIRSGSLTLIPIWPEEDMTAAAFGDGKLIVSGLKYGVFVKITGTGGCVLRSKL